MAHYNQSIKGFIYTSGVGTGFRVRGHDRLMGEIVG